MEQYKFFIQDLVVLLKEKLEQSRERQISTNDEFDKGVNMGIYESLDLIKQQANAFGIPLQEIGLDDFCMEQLL